MEGGLINPIALIRTGAAKGVTSQLIWLLRSPQLDRHGGFDPGKAPATLLENLQDGRPAGCLALGDGNLSSDSRVAVNGWQ